MKGEKRLSRLERTIGARSVLILLIITQLLRMTISLFTSFVSIESSQSPFAQPDLYYTLVMLQEALIFGLPVFLFVYLLRPRYVPVLKGQMAFPSLSASMRTVFAAMLGLVMFELYATLWTVLLDMLGLKLIAPPIPLPNNGAQVILAVTAVAILPGVVEELLFRGVLMEGLRRELPIKAAIGLTALLFAFMHGSIAALPVHVALGFILTLLAFRQGNLQLAMIYHFVHNATSLVFCLYLRNVVQSIEVSAQTAEPATITAMLTGILPLLAVTTLGYVMLMRPLLTAPPKKETAPAASELTDGKQRWFRGPVAILLVTLGLLMIPWFALEILPL